MPQFTPIDSINEIIFYNGGYIFILQYKQLYLQFQRLHTVCKDLHFANILSHEHIKQCLLRLYYLDGPIVENDCSKPIAFWKNP